MDDQDWGGGGFRGACLEARLGGKVGWRVKGAWVGTEGLRGWQERGEQHTEQLIMAISIYIGYCRCAQNVGDVSTPTFSMLANLRTDSNQEICAPIQALLFVHD